jgi:cytochrome c peroxidase
VNAGFRHLRAPALLAVALCAAACGRASSDVRTGVRPWEAGNPIRLLAPAPFGMDLYLAEARVTPAPARVRLGRWLFFDTRLSADNTISCATCHRPEYAFSQPTPVPTGIGGRKGVRKTPTFVNEAVTLEPHFFWDGRASSLEGQLLEPIANPNEMGNTHEAMIGTLSRIPGYKPYFREAFGTEDITTDRVAHAIADYERTRVSGNAPYDRWEYKHDQRAVSPAAKLGSELFFFKARCSQCHVGSNFTDGQFHNLGVGWDARTQAFADVGRMAVSHDPADRGRFKTPGLREVSRHPPYMHDGSILTLRQVVEMYNAGGTKNPRLDGKIVPLGLTDTEVSAIVEFLHTLEGDGYQDVPPSMFPQ